MLKRLAIHSLYPAILWSIAMWALWRLVMPAVDDVLRSVAP